METKILPAGTVVRIKSLAWWNSQPKNEMGSVDCGADSFTNEMAIKYCGRTATILKSLAYVPQTYVLDIDQGRWHWTNEMFESTLALAPLCESECTSWDYNKPK